MIRLDVRFTGRVQGVYFRATTQDVARSHRVTGWVRNEPDGSVRCVVEGESDELERFLAAVQQAKRDNIEHTEVVRGDATREYDGFTILY